MKRIESKQDYQIYKNAIETFVDKTKQIPQQVFNDSFRYFLFITFDEIFMEVFFYHMKKYVSKIQETEFEMVVLDPDPEAYFFHHFGRYGILVIDDPDSYEDYLSDLSNPPDNFPADALIHNSNLILVTSNNGKWAVLGDREMDIGICAFADEESMNKFKDVYGDDLLDGVTVAAEYIYGPGDEHRSKKEEFCVNYSNRHCNVA